MIILHLFSGTSSFSSIATGQSFIVYSLDLLPAPKSSKKHFQCDFLEWNFAQLNPLLFDYILIGFPCNTFSKASGKRHFKDEFTPLTDQAEKAVKMLFKLRQILQHFSKAMFILENPVSAIEKNFWFKFYISHLIASRSTLYQFEFGHCVPKHTALFSNRHLLLIHNPYYRQWNRFQKKKLSNLTTSQRQRYPDAFCLYLLEIFKTFSKHE